jgi:hypothetical protein
MTTRISFAEWKGTLKEGSGTMKLASGAYEGRLLSLRALKKGREPTPKN